MDQDYAWSQKNRVKHATEKGLGTKGFAREEQLRSKTQNESSPCVVYSGAENSDGHWNRLKISVVKEQN